MVYLPGAEYWVADSLLVPRDAASSRSTFATEPRRSGITSMLLSLLLAWVVLTFSTGNFITSSIATITIGMIATIVLGFIQILGWGLGPLESILIVIVIGRLSSTGMRLGRRIQRRLHRPPCRLVHGFAVARATGQGSRRARAHGELGPVRPAASLNSLFVIICRRSGAVSTLGASLPMFAAQIVFFQKFGYFVFMTIALSLVFSLGFFAAVLCNVGPLGKSGEVANLYAGVVKTMHEHVAELEEQQRLIKKQKLVSCATEPENDASPPQAEIPGDENPSHAAPMPAPGKQVLSLS